MDDRGAPLPERFRRHVRELGAPESGDGVVVGVSGGVDSVALLHLLHFTSDLETGPLTVAHLDHALRDGSRADARWVRGLAAAWSLPFLGERLESPPSDEAGARAARYRFLHAVRERVGARWVLTAHHADDQAETVLFRIVRGTGLRGLQGMRGVDAGSALVRPLLPFRRSEIEAYAQDAGLTWREDPSNVDPRHARNVLRHTVIPTLEAGVARGTVDALLRLARIASREEAAMEALLESVLGAVVDEVSERRIIVARSRFLGYHSAVRARVLRTLARRLGSTLDAAGTRVAMEFSSSGASGGEVHLSGGLVLVREFDRLVLEVRRAGSGPHEGAERTDGGDEVVVDGSGSGRGELVLPGRSLVVAWSGGAASGRPEPADGRNRWSVRIRARDADFPLRLRGWSAGDRIRLGYGTKKVVKLFAEARIPRGDRRSRPVLVDASGRVLWVPGLARSVEPPDAEPREEGESEIIITVSDAE